MRAFVCKRCRELVPFENRACANCGVLTGFDPVSSELEALEYSGAHLVPLGQGQGPRWACCARCELVQCNWLVPATGAPQTCLSCRLTGNLPPDRDNAYRRAFTKAELAKRRLVFQLHQLRLPIIDREQDPRRGLSFQLLAADRHVVTGHENGVIAIDLNETDDSFREQTRAQFGEPYRTLLGHFRHEIGHYYWEILVAKRFQADGLSADSVSLRAEARRLFGDDTEDYAGARQRHYANGARRDWGDRYVSAYAAMHPLEDWAETFAHYLHIWDAVQTAASFGVLVVGPVDDRTGRRDPAKASVPSEDTASLEGFDAVIADWSPLTLALNALNRSLGKDDLYPFELPPAVTAKLAFVHRVITAASAVPAGPPLTSGRVSPGS